MNDTYTVVIEDFAERHFIKSFAKKYKSAWLLTLDSLLFELKKIDKLKFTDKAEIIVDNVDYQIWKINFRIFGRNESAKSSGNRVIACVDKKDKIVKVLLVYGKTDLGSGKETNEWKRIIKSEYSFLKDIN